MKKTDATKKKPPLSLDQFVALTVTYVAYAMMIVSMILMAPLIMLYGYWLFCSGQFRNFKENTNKKVE